MTTLLISPHSGIRPSTLDTLADEIADGVCDLTLPKVTWTHQAHLLAAISLVRRHGAAGALDVLSAAIPRYNEASGTMNTPTSGYHHTLTVFYVWAVARLLDAGLSTAGVLWHPLTDRNSPSCWWEPATLWSSSARLGWVEPTLALPGEPRPELPTAARAA